MTLSTANKELEDQLIANVPSDDGNVPLPIGLPHQTFAITAPSVTMVINEGQAQQVSLGSPGTNIVRYVGLAIMTIYTAGGNGTVEADGYAETIMTAFRNQDLGDVICKIPYPQVRSQSGKFYSLNVVVPYTRDSLEA